MLRRAVFSDFQRKGLEKAFQKQKYISKPDRKKLAEKLSLKDSQVSSVLCCPITRPTRINFSPLHHCSIHPSILPCTEAHFFLVIEKKCPNFSLI